MKKSHTPDKHPECCVRHDIDPFLVMDQIDKKIANHEKLRAQWAKRDQDHLDEYARDVEQGTAQKKWVTPPQAVENGSRLIDDWNQKERNYYSRVRVIELPIPGKRFVLVYGDEDDSNPIRVTGPSDSLEKSIEWFLSGGR